MTEETVNFVNAIRYTKRSDLKEVRNKHKELILCNKRLTLSETHGHVYDVTFSEFNELLLKLKQNTVPLELLKKIKNSCNNYEYIEALFRNEGAFNSLLRILIGNNTQKQLEAAACLTNLTCGYHKCSYKVAKASGVYLISFISGSSYFLQDQSIWALANIANDCVECFNVIKSQGVLPALLKAIESPLSNVVQSVVFALNACTKYDDPEIISLIQKDLPKHLLALIEKDNINRRMFLDAAFAFSNCCFLSVKYSLSILGIESAERIINTLLSIIQNPKADLVTAIPLVRSIGMLSYDNKISEFLVSFSDFYRSIQIIASVQDSMHLIKEAIWALCNVTASMNTVWITSDLTPLINSLEIILKQEKSMILQVLYCLSILLSKHKYTSFQLMHHDIFVEIKSLLESEEKTISDAVRVFLEIVQQQ